MSGSEVLTEKHLFNMWISHTEAGMNRIEGCITTALANCPSYLFRVHEIQNYSINFDNNFGHIIIAVAYIAN
jgi:hypothetical protein